MAKGLGQRQSQTTPTAKQSRIVGTKLSLLVVIMYSFFLYNNTFTCHFGFNSEVISISVNQGSVHVLQYGNLNAL